MSRYNSYGSSSIFKFVHCIEISRWIQHTRRATIEEQGAKFLYVVGHNVRNHVMSFFFRRSGETIKCHFRGVLQASIELEEIYMKQLMGHMFTQRYSTNLGSTHILR